MQDFAGLIIIAIIACVLAFSMTNCTPHEIEACGSACEKSNQKMLKYNKVDGCVCSEDNKP